MTTQGYPNVISHPRYPQQGYTQSGYPLPAFPQQGMQPIQGYPQYILSPTMPAAPVRGSVWPKVLGIVVAVVIGLGIALYFVGQLSLGTPYKVTEHDTVYYAGQATESDAKAVGGLLQTVGYFNNSWKKDVMLRTDDTGTQVRFVVNDGWNTPEVDAAFKVIGKSISKNLGRTVKVKLVDPKLKELKEITVG